MYRTEGNQQTNRSYVSLLVEKKITRYSFLLIGNYLLRIIKMQFWMEVIKKT